MRTVTTESVSDVKNTSDQIKADDESFLSRRQVFVTAGSAIMASVLPQLAFALPPLSDTPPIDEGFFFVIPGKKGGSDDPEGDRVFFISSSWLPLFEVTDLLAKSSVSALVTISNTSPAIITWTSHQFGQGDKIRFSGGSLPSTIVEGQTYFVENILTNDTFTITDHKGNTVNASTVGSTTATKLNGKKKVVDKLKMKTKQKWNVFYSDDIAGMLIANPAVANPADVIPVPDPGTKTYLAMSIA